MGWPAQLSTSQRIWSAMMKSTFGLLQARVAAIAVAACSLTDDLSRSVNNHVRPWESHAGTRADAILLSSAGACPPPSANMFTG